MAGKIGRLGKIVRRIRQVLKKYMRFVGPGIMVSVAYMDPGNYSTAVAAGSAYKYNLLFLILLSSCLAVFLQVLSAKLGAVTGLDLAANCRANLPHKTNLFLYILAELAIIATDVAEVVGTAIALNIIFKLPLFAGVIVTIIDILVVLMAYRPNGPLLFVRIFEFFVSLLVGATVVCFGVELYQVSHDETIDFSYVEVFKGFLPNSKVVDMSDREGGNGLFLSLAILGATVMPHSLYLGSGLVQARLKDYDLRNGHYKPANRSGLNGENEGISSEEDPATQLYKDSLNEDDMAEDYRPSIHAIKDTMSYTIAELIVSLFTVALFVNSAILIVAGATLGGNSKRDDADDSDSDNEGESQNKADLYTIYKLLSEHLSPTAGFVFALALLCSGQSAGIVCTLAGQMVLEGFLLWSMPPVARRLVTRGIAIVPCLVVVSTTGRDGLSSVLNFSQVVLAILLPLVTAPLILFTCSKKYMRVPILVCDEGIDDYLPLDEDDADVATLSETTTNDTSATLVKNSNKRYRVTEPSIRLKDLRTSHPCLGWDDNDDLDFQQSMPLTNEAEASEGMSRASPSYGEWDIDANESMLASGYDQLTHRVKGYKDMSNGPITSFFAILVWLFISCLNMFLITSMLLDYDVPF